MIAFMRRLTWRSVFAVTGGLTVDGRLPQGPCVVVANHTSHADAPALVAALSHRSRPSVAAAEDYWFRRPLRRRVCRVAVGAFPVRRTGGGSADLDAAAALLRAGRTVVVLPEGTRSRDGELGRFRGGAFRLAAESAVPVVPVALIGTCALLPVHGRPRPARVAVRIGTPMSTPSPEEARLAVAALAADPAPPAESRTRHRVAAFADTRVALLVVALWAFAEALSWPLVPEFALGLLALAGVRWRRMVTLCLAALGGTLVGCLLSATLAGAGHAPPAPLTTHRMTVVAAGQLSHEGVFALQHQPWSGIPVKVYAVAAGRHHEPLGLLGIAVVLSRGSRLLVVAAVIGTIARLVPRRAYLPVATFAVVTFAAGLHEVVAHWA